MELILSFIDLGMSLLEDKRVVSSDDSSSVTKGKLEKWERSNSLNLMIIKRSDSKIIHVVCLAVKQVRNFVISLEKV